MSDLEVPRAASGVRMSGRISIGTLSRGSATQINPSIRKYVYSLPASRWGRPHMASSTAIEWTDATWNPVTGCTKISAGCDHCYAERFSERFRGTRGHPFETGFDLTLRPQRIEQPLRWREPRMIFVNSMSDLFHKEIPQDFVARVFDTMERAPWHTFQVLTKRSSLMRNFLRARYGKGPGPIHIWFGVSVEDGSRSSRIKH